MNVTHKKDPQIKSDCFFGLTVALSKFQTDVICHLETISGVKKEFDVQDFCHAVYAANMSDRHICKQSNSFF